MTREVVDKSPTVLKQKEVPLILLVWVHGIITTQKKTQFLDEHQWTLWVSSQLQDVIIVPRRKKWTSQRVDSNPRWKSTCWCVFAVYPHQKKIRMWVFFCEKNIITSNGPVFWCKTKGLVWTHRNHPCAQPDYESCASWNLSVMGSAGPLDQALLFSNHWFQLWFVVWNMWSTGNPWGHGDWDVIIPLFIIIYWFVVWNMNFIFPYIGNVIIPTDELMFFKGVAWLNHQPELVSTSKSLKKK